MSTVPKPISVFDRLFARWQERYLIQIQLMAQQISLVSASIGIVYTLINGNLSRLQVLHLLVAAFFLVLIANLLLPIYTFFITSNARKRLFAIKRGLLDVEGQGDEALAWKEILLLPWRFAVAEIITATMLVAVVMSIYMSSVAHTSATQTLHVVIGGMIAGLGLTLHNVMFLDRALMPARLALMPRDPALRTADFGVRMQTRLQIVIGFLVLIAMTMVGPLGYQKLLNAMTPGVDLAANLRLYQVQLIVLSLITIGVAIGIASLVSSLIASPVRSVIQVMRDVEEGHLSTRALVTSSDETAELTIRLNRMLDRLQTSQTDLERRVEERTNDLARRASMLQAATQVARQAVASQDLNTLLADTATLVSERFDYYHTGIFLIDEHGNDAVLQAASSEGGRRMLEHGHRLVVGHQGLVGNAAYYNRPQIAANVGEDAVFFDNPELPGTRSEVALPLGVRGKVIGVLDIQSVDMDAFPPDVIELLQTMADQIALAIQNARLLTESQNALHRLEALTAEGVRQAWSERIRQQRRSYRFTPLNLTPFTPVSGKTGFLPLDPEKKNQFEASITLRGQKIGTLVFHHKEAVPWPEADRTLAGEVANQVGLALENVRLLEEAQHRAAQEQALSELTARLSQSLDPDIIMQTAVRELRQLPNVTEVSVFLSPPEAAAPEAPSQ